MSTTNVLLILLCLLTTFVAWSVRTLREKPQNAATLEAQSNLLPYRDPAIIHRNWTIGILLALFVAASGTHFANFDPTGTTINAVVAVTSILLALISIIYAFTSNTTLAASLGQINTSVSSLTSAADVVTQASKSAAEINEKFTENSRNLTSGIETLQSKVSEIATTVTAMGESLTEVKANSGLLPVWLTPL